VFSVRIVDSQDVSDLAFCTKCKVPKDCSEFNKDRSKGNGLKSACRECTKGMYKKWSSSEEGQSYKKEYDKKRFSEHRESELLRSKNWRDKNLEHHRSQVSAWKEKNPDKVKATERRRLEDPVRRSARNAWYRKKRREDMNFRIAGSLRSRLRAATHAQLKGKSPKQGSAIESLGCSMKEFLLHLSSQFQQGMSWENYDEWHIDHIQPLSGFDLSDPVQVKKVCHYSNLQPLWAEDNLKKGESNDHVDNVAYKILLSYPNPPQGELRE